ncbi:glycerophosphodiester phosphodiesterase family protein [Nocardioides sp. B-3]|uniref:glycerophosphodiester phosphodiesterase family protein n=1 Tax=Nocardioides sp. B-3 TaxID=2895565 RepID=UPI00300E3615
MRPQVVAHRGASHENAEHTLRAYKRAIEVGAEALGVRRTTDGRRPPGLCARPRPSPYGRGQGRHLHDEPRAAGRARLRVLEEPVGRA